METKNANWDLNLGNLALETASYHDATQPLKYNRDQAASESCQTKWQNGEYTALFKGQATTQLQPVITREECRLNVASSSNFSRRGSNLILQAKCRPQ